MGNITISSNVDTISKRIQYLSENYPDLELFVFYRGEIRDPYTARQLFELGGKFAHRLRHQYGFQRHDIIANTIPNSPERLITDIGIALAGCATLNGQILLADGSDFLQSARNSKCRGVITRPVDDSAAWRLLKQYVTGDTLTDVIRLSCDKTPDMTSALLVSRIEITENHFLEDLRNSEEEVFIDTTITPEDLVVIFTTSGSTGYSKLVDRTHFESIQMANALKNSSEIGNLAEIVMYSDRLLGWPGGFPFHEYCSGQRRVMMDIFDSHGGKRGDIMWHAIENENCNVAVIFPLELDSVLKYLGSRGDTDYRIKYVASGAQPLKKAQLEGMLTIGEKLCVGYGSTEIVPISAGFIRSSSVEDFFCGKPTANVTVRVVDESGYVCKPRQTGIIHVKAEPNFRGYFNRLQNPDPNTIKCFTKDGWFDTEDVGFLDEDGNLYVMGRNKDTITYGSSVFYPGWLEAKILQHPDVAEACILPVSDPVLFHNICACVKRNVGSDLTEDKLKSYCESVFVADLDSDLTPMPKFFMVYEHFPESASGKPDKQALKKIAEDKFGLVRPNQAQ